MKAKLFTPRTVLRSLLDGSPGQKSIIGACILMCALLLTNVNRTMAQCGSWSAVGAPGFSAGAIQYTDMAIDTNGTPYIVYSDASNGHKATIKKFTGGSWVAVGGVASTAGVLNCQIAIAPSGMPYVSYSDSANSLKATVKRFNGASWVTVGVEGFSSGRASGLDLAIDRSGFAYVVYSDLDNGGKLSVMKFAGAWSFVGSEGFSGAQVYYPAIAVDAGGTPYVIFNMYYSGSTACLGCTGWPAVVRKYSATSGWTAVGTDGDIAYTDCYDNSIAIDPSGNPYVSFSTLGQGYKNVVKNFSGGAWHSVGGASMTDDQVYTSQIALDGSGTPYVVFGDYSSHLSVRKFAGSSWANVGSSPVSSGAKVPSALTISKTGAVYVGYRDTVYGDKVTVSQFSLATITGSMAPCVGGTSTLSATATGGTWSSSNTAVATVGTDGVVAAGAVGTTTITYAYGSGCSATAVVTVSSAANAGVISGVDSMCTQGHTTLSTTGSGGTWSVEAGAGVAIGASTGILSGGWIYTPTNPHIYYIVNNGCGTDTATKMVYIKSMIDPGYLPDGLTDVCVGSTISFAGYSGLTPGGSWWFNSGVDPDPVSVDPVTGVITGLIPTSGTSVNYRTANACGAPSITVGVRVLANSAGTLSGASSVAVGSSITLSSSVSGGTWSASNSNATVSGVTGAVTGVSDGTVTISYTVSNSCGTFVATKVITVGTTSITGTLTISGSGTTTLTGVAPGGTWSTGCDNIATVNSGGVVTAVSNGLATITYTTGTGSTTAVVTVNMTSSAITGTLSVCASSTTALSHPVTGGSWSSSNSNATVNSSGVVTGVTGGTAAITYTYGSGCSSIVIITINPAVSAGVITGASTVDAAHSITLSESVTGGTWSASNGNATVSTAGVVTGVATGTVTISYSVTGSCGSAVATKVITVTGGTALTISGGLTVCTGATTALASSISGGTWSSGDATVASVSASGVVTGVSAGVAAITYTTSSSSATVSVTVTTGSSSITGVSTLCPGTTSSLSVGAAGGTWTGGSTVIATVGSTGIVTGIGAGTTTFTYSTGTGCNATITVTVNSAPAVISGTLKACPGASTMLGSGTTGGTWSTNDGSIATADAATGVITGVTAGITTVTYTTGLGCYRTATFTVNPTPDAITGTMVICTGGITTLADVTAGASWSSSNTSVANIASNGVVNGISAGNAMITYTAATGCLATAVVTVNGVPAPIAGPATGCTGSAITLSNNVPGGAWSSNNTSVATVDETTGVVTGVVPGMATITYTSGVGCYKTKAITIAASPAVSGNPMACVGLTTTLSGGSGTWSSSTPSVATIAISGGYVSAVSAGTSTMTFTPTASGCPAAVVVTVVPVPAAITGPVQMCTGAVATLTNTSTGGVWTSSNTAIATVGSATGITTAVGTGGTAVISYSIGNNCRVTKSITMKPLPTVISGTATVCSPMTTTLAVGTSGGTWTSSDASVATLGTTGSVLNGIVTGVSAGTTDITYTITATGCARSTTVTVNAGLNPGTITSSGGFTLHTISPLTSVTLSSSGAAGGAWGSSNPAVATVNASTGVVTAVAAGTTTITYAVTNACTNIATKVITVTAGRPAVSQQSSVATVQLYPNPTTGAFTLVSEEAGALSVFSINGREITSYGIGAGINPLNMPAEIAAGIYMCKFTSESGSTTMVRLVYER